MIVVDASVLVEGLIGTGAMADRLARTNLVAPALIDAEAGGAVRRRWRHGSLTDERADAAIQALTQVEILRFEHRALVPRAWQLRHNLSFADALYVALAEQLGIPLLTLDARIAGAPGITATVQVPGRG